MHGPDGTRQGFHWWNRLAGVDIDLTREQFGADELVQEPRVLARPPGPLRRGEPQYRLLRARVLEALAVPGLTRRRGDPADTVEAMSLLAAASDQGGITGWLLDLVDRLGAVGVGLTILIETVIPPIP